MLMTDLIHKKRDGETLSEAEIDWMVRGYTDGVIPDYQMSAMMMAMYFQGLTHEETVALTLSMLHSGETIDLSAVEGVKADKHSTGGVGDKTSLVLCPMLAACGVKMAKMSGRGLGHTGGTLDKLEGIPGVSTEMTAKHFFDTVNQVGFCIAAQTKEIDPADKLMYGLRDVTGTVPVQGLIVSSIMSKKLAAGADVIVLDVKCGSGSFMKTEADARALAAEMVQVGNDAGRATAAVITDMDEPLGEAVGNILEVKEAIAALKGEFGGNLLELCLVLGSSILTLCGKADGEAEARALLEKTVADGTALEKLADFVAAQGGDRQMVLHPELLPTAPIVLEVKAEEKGYVNHIDTEGIGLVSLHLGGGRATKDGVIDPTVGVIVKKKRGDAVEPGDTLAILHASSREKAQEAAAELRSCYSFNAAETAPVPFFKGKIQ